MMEMSAAMAVGAVVVMMATMMGGMAVFASRNRRNRPDHGADEP